MTESLKPCPFCGGEAAIMPYIDKFDGSVGGYYVECKACGAKSYVCACKSPAVCDWNNAYLVMRT